MRELTVAEQRYQAVLAVISDGSSISQVAGQVGVSRQTLHSWLARYGAEGLEGWWIGRIGRRRVHIRCRRWWRVSCWSCAGRAWFRGNQAVSMKARRAAREVIHQQFGERLVAQSGMGCGEGLVSQPAGAARFGDEIQRDAFGTAEASRVGIIGVDGGGDLLFGQPGGAGDSYVPIELVA
jgi:transposase